MADRKSRGTSVHSSAGKAARVLGALLWVVVGLFLLAVGLLLWWSRPGKPEPFLDQSGEPLPNSISEKVFVPLGGVRQGMFIRGKDAGNPVLLYLHGGMPDYFLTQRYPTGLEDLFTVVWWEQRGAGLSYRPDLPRQTLTLEQLVSDTLELTDHLRQRFGQEKIYLMGRSGGSFVGIHAAARSPERYHAYIGVAQMSDQLESERLAHRYMLEQYEKLGDAVMVRRLEAAPVTRAGGTLRAYLALRDGAMHRLGIGTTRNMISVIAGMFLPSLQFRQYTLAEKVNLWRAKARSGVSVLWDAATTTDLSEQLPALALPVYFLHGVYDYTCSYPLAKDYFAKLEAPVKGFYTFEHSAHSPVFEEPEKVRRILQEDVLRGANALADPR